jgi:hypothetical protein
MQPRRTRRRKGRGTLVQPLWKQERPVSALAVRSAGCHLGGGPGADVSYKPRNGEVGACGAGVGAVHSTVEAVAAEPRWREGTVLGLRIRRR